jgi:hypothetical protein
MYEHEHVEFGILLRDLCISTDRPFDKDLLRVFLNDLKDVPLQALQRQAAILARKGDKRFKSADLRPPAEESGPLVGFDNHAIVDRINAHVLRNLWSHLSPMQRLYKHAWVYTRDKAAPRCVALKIEPDTVEVMVDGQLEERHYPGHYIRHEDVDAYFEPVTRADVPLQSRTGEFNDADEARALLNRK